MLLRQIVLQPDRATRAKQAIAGMLGANPMKRAA